MSKELEAVNKWLKEYLTLCEKLSTNQQERMLLNNDSPYNILKTYFESIDNVTPSEAMKELDEIIEYITEDKKVKYKATILFDCEIIKDALLKAQEIEKENTRHKKLEEELGCPLEVYVGINQRNITTIYDKNGIDHTIEPNTIIKDSFFAVNGFTLIECMWNMYCKTWWLKKDKSE